MPLLRLRSIVNGREGPESVFSGPCIRIGRSRDSDLILPEKHEPFSSGHHADAILDSNGTWWIVDGNSTNGTFVNGARVGRHAIVTGDRLTFGDDQFVAAVGGVPVRAVARVALLSAVVAALAAFALFIRRPPPAPAFEDIARLSAQSVFLVVIEENHMRIPIGTAFRIEQHGPEALVTNAHVAALLESRGAVGRGSGAIAMAIQGDTALPFVIAATHLHPRWRVGSIEKDVALLTLQNTGGALPLGLADSTALLQLNRGAPVATFGFPVVSTDVMRPRARLSVDIVGDVRGDYIESGLDIAPGTSGSPVFDQAGRVVGIVVGGDFTGGAGGPPRPTRSAANWVLSASVIRELLE